MLTFIRNGFLPSLPKNTMVENTMVETTPLSGAQPARTRISSRSVHWAIKSLPRSSFSTSLKLLLKMLLPAFFSFVILAASVAAEKAETTGKYTLTVDGTTYNPVAGDSAKGSNIVPKTSIIEVRGTHSSFDVDFKTLGVVDYTLTGAPDAERMYRSSSSCCTDFEDTPDLINKCRHGPHPNRSLHLQNCRAHSCSTLRCEYQQLRTT